MKNQRAIVFSLIMGTVAVLLMYYYVSQKEQFFNEKYEQIPVLIATEDIARYTRIEPTAIAVKLIPKPFKEPDALTQNDLERVQGYVADSTIRRGAQITETRISRPGESRVSILIPKETRACTLAVNEITGVAGLIRPGDHVDVIGTFKTVNEKTRVALQAEAVALLQNAPVLAVGRNYVLEGVSSSPKGDGLLASSRDSLGFSNVTLSVSPRDCMNLTVAQQVGHISLSLRSWGNRYGGDTFKELKDVHSTSATVSGIASPMEISPQPKWLEIRGEQALLAP